MTSLFPVSPQKARAELKKRLEEDGRLQRWKASNQTVPTPAEPTPAPTPAPAVPEQVLHRRAGRWIYVPIENAPAFERRHKFALGAVRELFHPDTGECLEVYFEGVFETRPA